MKFAKSFAVIGALFTESSAMRFYDDGLTVASPYSYTEM